MIWGRRRVTPEKIAYIGGEGCKFIVFSNVTKVTELKRKRWENHENTCL